MYAIPMTPFSKSLPSFEEGTLITSVSKKMGLIAAVREAAWRVGRFRSVYGADSNVHAIGQYGVDYFWTSPILDQLAPEQLIDYCRTHNIKVIIPTRDGELFYYASHLEKFQQSGLHLFISSQKSIALCLDKWCFAEELSKRGISVIPASLELPVSSSDRYVVKERRGAGSKSVACNLSREEALRHAKTLSQPLFQPYVSGIEWSVDLYRSRQGTIKGCVARRRDFVVDGESQVTTTSLHPALETLCSVAADHLGLYGHAIFQCIEEGSGALHMIECNPRFGGASTASLAVGLDSFFWFFLECLGSDLSSEVFIRRNDLRQIRHTTEIFLPWSLSST